MCVCVFQISERNTRTTKPVKLTPSNEVIDSPRPSQRPSNPPPILAKRRQSWCYVSWATKQKKRAGVRADIMSPKRLNKNRAGNRADIISSERLNQKRTGDRADNLPHKWLNKKRVGDRADFMPPKRLQKKRNADMPELMPPERLQKKRQLKLCSFDAYRKKGCKQMSYYVSWTLWKEKDSSIK